MHVDGVHNAINLRSCCTASRAGTRNDRHVDVESAIGPWCATPYKTLVGTRQEDRSHNVQGQEVVTTLLASRLVSRDDSTLNLTAKAPGCLPHDV